MRKFLCGLAGLLLFAAASMAQPVVVSTVAPAQANPGAAVIITGSGFEATPANNIVYFGATKAAVTAASATSLTVTVPLGATCRPVSVNNTTTGTIGYSSNPFLPTYDNSLFDAAIINFEAGVSLTTGGDGHSIAAGDLDGDGKTDIVVVNGSSNTISIWRNSSTTSSITSGSFDPRVDLTTQNSPYTVTLADIDMDGKLDIAVTNNVSNSISIFRNTATSGSITAASFAARVDIIGTNAGPRGIAINDIDMDGKPDIVIACNTANVLNVFRNTSTPGTISASTFDPKVNFTSGSGPTTVALADVDGDGKPELISVDLSSNQVSIFRNTSTSGIINSATFASSIAFATGAGTNPRGLCIGDLNSDNKPDIVVTNSQTNTFSVFRNTSTTGAISAGSLGTRVDYTTGTGPVSAMLGDINGDGKPDVVVANNTTSTVSVFRNTATTGAFTAASFAAPVNMATGTNPMDVTVADMDNDGLPDIEAANFSGSLSVLRNNPIAQITGTTTVCVAATTTLNNTTTGGTWESDNTSVATVGTSSGIVTGVAAGTATISYNVAGVHTTAIVTVNALPDAGAITGTATVCVGAVTTLTNAATGGVWSSVNTAAGTVDASGNVTGIGAGTTTISYLVATGCGTVVATKDVTVNALPVAGTVSGAVNVCSGGSVTLTPTQTGGTWSTTFALEASVDATGVVTGGDPGTATITYTITNGCGTATATHTLTVNPLPDAITGSLNVCEAATTTLASTTLSGVWSSGNTSIATVGTSTGIVSGIAAGVVVISYTQAGCSATAVVTVDQVPFTGSLSGAAVFCAGSTITISALASGGAWTSSDASVATVGTSGIVTGVGAGTAGITYTISNGCGIASANTVVTVEVTADAGSISGPVNVCASGSTIALTNTVTTGTWSSSNLLAATINASGIVTGVDPGTTTISYTVSNTCGINAATVNVTVNTLPDAISGPTAICKNATATLASTTSGGSWSSSAPSIISVDASGVITGVAEGSATISYTLVIGCRRTKTITVNPLPANITGTRTVCVGATTTLTNVNFGGTWVSDNPSMATIGSSSGIVTGIMPGTVIVTYSRPVTGCYITTIVTVNALPSAIVGDSVLCTGLADTFSATPTGGTWNVTVAYYASVGLHTGIVIANNVGSTTVTYTTTTGCKSFKQVTVNQSPTPILGAGAVCEGSTGVLTNAIPYGVWTSTNPGVGIINSSGVIAGISPGTSIVSYTLSNGCFRTAIVTINPLPAPVSGPTAVCTGNTITLTGSPTGGTWSSNNTAVATTAVGGVVSGISAGTAAISYTLYTGCKRAHVITVNASPTAISGTAAMCVGASALLSSSPLTGTWISGNTAVATVGSSAGLVTGVSAGTSVITYQLLSSGCKRTVIATVNPLPAAITGTAEICAGTTTTFTTTPAGGTWSSGAPLVAAVGVSSGVLSGLAGGTSVISYRTVQGCIGTKILTVNPLAVAGAILGPPNVCVAGSITLSATEPGGTWATVTGKASITSTGVATGVTAGIDTVIYRVTNMCNTARVKYAITVNPLPAIGTVSGEDSVCVGYSSMLTTTVLGGTWSSSNPAVATAGGGMVTGISTGTATISYAASNACGLSVATLNVTVVPPVDAGTITGPDTVCYFNTVTLSSPSPGGKWSTTSLYASVDSVSGIVKGLAPGLAVIRYVARNECSTDTAYFTIYVKYSIDCPTMVGPNVMADAAIKIYPTPTHGSITVEAPAAGIINIYSIDGKQVGSYMVNKAVSSFSLPAGITAGIYMCRFSGKDGSTAILKIVYEP